MKVAVSTSGPTPESKIEDRFGRSRFFLVYDTAAGGFTVVDNSDDQSAQHGAGVGTAQKLIDASVEAVITGNCGPKARSLLEKAHIHLYYKQTGTAADALAQYTSGELPEVTV